MNALMMFPRNDRPIETLTVAEFREVLRDCLAKRREFETTTWPGVYYRFHARVAIAHIRRLTRIEA